MLRPTLVAVTAALAAAENPKNCKSPKSAPHCYGIGEYTLGTQVSESKCPQLPLRTLNNQTGEYEATPVLERQCLYNGKQTQGPECFDVTDAVWEENEITGVGLNGYWLGYKGTTTASSEKYGWIDGVIPDQLPEPTSADLVQGAEVLCRSPEITGAASLPALGYPCDAATNPNGCWMQGQLVDKSPDNTWVCKLTDTNRKLMAFTPVSNIRLLCFAKAEDPATGTTCDPYNATCDTCTPYCTLPIAKAGYNCPTQVGLHNTVLKYTIPTTLNKTRADPPAPPGPPPPAPDNLFHPGQVTGMYYTSPEDLKAGKNLQYQVDYKVYQPVWGPQPGSNEYLIPVIHTQAHPDIKVDEKSFGQQVLCPQPPGLDPPGLPQPIKQTYQAGTIYNTPLQTSDSKYHVYTCDNPGVDPTKSLKCDPQDMLTQCWPTIL